jgi:hypothetical protein
MKSHILFTIAFVLTALEARAQPPDMFQHLFWNARGTHQNENMGITGLDYIGRLNDTILHAVAIGGDGGSYLVFNRDSLDTVRHFKFPGTKVNRGNMNGDTYPDLCASIGKINGSRCYLERRCRTAS